MNSVFVIEYGSYSDYRVVGVFTTKENAELVVAKMKEGGLWETPTIAEWPLDPAIRELNAGLAQWRVLMLRDGTAELVEKRDFDHYDIAGEVHVWERTKAPAYIYKGVPDVLDGTVWARDEEHAIKVMNEHRARMILSGEFK